MSISVACPQCAAKLNAPDSVAGKKVKCPKCQSVITVPAAQSAESAFEVVDDEPAPPKKPAAKPKAVVKATAEVDDEDETPRKKARAQAEDDDEDDQPKKKKKKKKKAADDDEGGVSMARNIVMGVILLILLGVAAYVFYDRSQKQKDANSAAPAANTSDDGSPVANPTIRPGGRKGGPGPGRVDAAESGAGGPKGDSGTARKGLPPFFHVGSLALAGDGKQLAAFGTISLGKEGGAESVAPSVRVWNPLTERPEAAREFRSDKLRFAGPVALSSDGKILAAYSSFDLVFWKVDTGEVLSECKPPSAGSMPHRMRFTEDGSSLIFVNDKGIVTVKVADGTATVKTPKEPPLSTVSEYVPSLKRVAGLTLAGGTGIGLLTWDPASDGPARRVTLEGAIGFTPRIAVSADGQMVAVCAEPLNDKVKIPVSLHNVADGKRVGKLPEDDDPNFRQYLELSLSADGQFLAGAGSGKIGGTFHSIDLFRISDGKRLHRSTGEPGHGGRFAQHLTFSADGKTLYYVRQGNTVVAIDTETGKERTP